MKEKIILTILLVFLFLNGFAQTPDWLWANEAGALDDDYGYDIAVDASGNVYTTGSFQGTVDFDPGPGIFNLISAGQSDIFISKLDATGNFVWAKRIGGLGFDESYGIALDSSGNIYTAGSFEGTVDFNPNAGTYYLNAPGADIFVLKLNNSGNFIWAKKMGGSIVSKAYSMAIDGSGNVYTTGYFYGTADFDPGAGTFNITATAGDIFISKLNPSGNFVWAKGMGAASADFGFSLAIDITSGDVYTTGTFLQTVDFDPGIGVFNLTSFGDHDIFISKLDSSGNFVWARQMGGVTSDIGWSIAVGNNDVYTTGEFSGTADFDPGVGVFNLNSASGYNDNFICKLDTAGNFVWAKAMAGTSSIYGYSIALDASENVVTTGTFTDTADFDPGPGIFNLTSAGFADIFISKLDSSGNFIWAISAGGEVDADNGWSLAIDGFGSIYVTGYFQSPSIVFGSFTLLNADSVNSSNDLFIAKLDVLTGMEIADNKSVVFLFPNPASNKLSINGLSDEAEINIYNVSGGRVIDVTLTLTSNEIDISDLTSGIYFIRLKTGDAISSAKFVKE